MLSVRNLQKHYPGFSLDCTLEVPPGQITGLIGENGSGKTTLFKTVLGLVRAEGGQSELLGMPIDALTPADRSRIGVVLSDSGFSGYISVGDVRRILKHLYPAFREDWFQTQCRQFGLGDKKKIRELSTGMKAKLKIITALSHEAKFLILDEPTAGLDVVVRDEVLTLLREYMEEDEERSILISSHISTDLEHLCDDFYMIHQGQIVFHEDTDRLLSDYGILKVRYGDYESLDKRYILRRKNESFGYSLLTDQRAFYRENAPDMVMEQTGLDDLILLMTKGVSI